MIESASFICNVPVQMFENRLGSNGGRLVLTLVRLKGNLSAYLLLLCIIL